MSEKRRERRLPERLPCEVHIKSTRLAARVDDVSRHGLFVHMAEPPPLDHVVALTIHLPGGPLEVMATVKRRVRVGFDEEGAGMLLFALSGSARARWETFVRGGEEHGVPLAVSPPRLTSADAAFLVQLDSTRAMLDFFDQKIVPLQLVYVTPPVRKLGARIDVILVHPDTDEEASFFATVTELSADRPERMGIRFDPIDRARRQAFLAMLGPLSHPDGRPMIGAQLRTTGSERVTQYAFISPKLRGKSLDDQEPIDVVEGTPIEEPVQTPPELELVDKRELFDFQWDATKKGQLS
jgi:PilZ domain